MNALDMNLSRHAQLVGVKTTHGRGLTPEEHAERCVERIVSVSDTASEEIRAQAHAFKKQVEAAVLDTIRTAVQSDRTTVYNALMDAGERDLAELIRRL